MPNRLDLLRSQYTALIESYQNGGEHQKAAECVELALSQGIWREALQRPLHFEPELHGPPIHRKEDFSFTEILESKFAEIREEFDAIMDGDNREFDQVKEAYLVEGGTWDQVVFFEGGQKFQRTCDRFPLLSNLLESIPEVVAGAGVCYLSWLDPKTHIRPHFGPTNTRLRVHFGIKVPKDTSMRVKDQYFTWEEGKCIVFDDSFEHEVWNLSAEPRVVLLFDIFHPRLTPEQKAGITTEQASFVGQIEAYMTEHGLKRIQRCGTNGVSLSPEPETEKTILRYMHDSKLHSAEMVDGKLSFKEE